jgi:hypothetical protein
MPRFARLFDLEQQRSDLASRLLYGLTNPHTDRLANHTRSLGQPYEACITSATFVDAALSPRSQKLAEKAYALSGLHRHWKHCGKYSLIQAVQGLRHIGFSWILSADFHAYADDPLEGSRWAKIDISLPRRISHTRSG